MKKDIPFDWLLACQSAFDSLKKMVTKALIFVHYKQNVKIILETDSSDYISSRIFFQWSDNRLLYLIEFFSKNLNPAECNYEIYDKKLLAIIRYFE